MKLSILLQPSPARGLLQEVLLGKMQMTATAFLLNLQAPWKKAHDEDDKFNAQINPTKYEILRKIHPRKNEHHDEAESPAKFTPRNNEYTDSVPSKHGVFIQHPLPSSMEDGVPWANYGVSLELTEITQHDDKGSNLPVAMESTNEDSNPPVSTTNEDSDPPVAMEITN